MTIRRILIANRGEIAMRIIATCQGLGIETVLAASDADRESVPARIADRVVALGPAAPAQSYLSVPRVIAAARQAGADAIHPGYGFLSENAALGQACTEAGIVFIGASDVQLASVGDKLRAREIAQAAGLPVVPGGVVEAAEDAQGLLETIGYPALVKAVGGGGGRGLRRIDGPADAADIVAMAMAEAEAAFGDGRVYLERFIAQGRHVEVQVLGDGERIIHIGERDCSIQRRYQKLVEEAPAPGLTPALRDGLRKAAIGFAKALDYRGLGTVEFLVDAQRGEFFFLEMNARIQVEHPVTEAITGLDLVAEQICVAEGAPLRLKQDEIGFDGHAIEFRINAEDAGQDFRPSPGTVTRAIFPAGDGIRIDTHIETGAKVPPFYDSLLAKLIVSGADRADAIARARGALADCRIEGVKTNLAMHRAIIDSPEFQRGGVDTNWFQRFWTKQAMEAAQ